ARGGGGAAVRGGLGCGPRESFCGPTGAATIGAFPVGVGEPAGEEVAVMGREASPVAFCGVAAPEDLPAVAGVGVGVGVKAREAVSGVFFGTLLVVSCAWSRGLGLAVWAAANCAKTARAAIKTLEFGAFIEVSCWRYLFPSLSVVVLNVPAGARPRIVFRPVNQQSDAVGSLR